VEPAPAAYGDLDLPMIVAHPGLMVTFGSSWVSIVERLNPSVCAEPLTPLATTSHDGPRAAVLRRREGTRSRPTTNEAATKRNPRGASGAIK
jgi:hypothetical protein